MKTIKLYDTDSHIKDFEATIVSCLSVSELPEKLQRFAKAAKDAAKQASKHAETTAVKQDSAFDIYALVLDQTAFFAEGGGQAADRGTLSVVGGVVSDGSDTAMTVLDVQELDSTVYHFVALPACAGDGALANSGTNVLQAGNRVRGVLDWEFRFTNMQQHSGEHVLSGICYAWKGYHNVGFHMGKELTTIDFDGPLTREELVRLEQCANEIVYENQPVTVFYPSKEELDAMDYRSKKELAGDVRIVKVGEADLCACCAPHVRKTGEIGIIKIVHAENYKGGIRISIVCGMRAVKDYAAKHDSLERMANLLTTKIENVEPQMNKTLAEEAAMHERIASLSKSLIDFKAKALLENCAAPVRIAIVERELDAVSGRLLINRILEQAKGSAAVLLPKNADQSKADSKPAAGKLAVGKLAVGKPAAGKLAVGEWMFIVGSNTQDLRGAAKILREQLGARGGGSKEMIQGIVAGNADTILEAMRGQME